MKKILLLIVGMILFTFYACSDDNIESDNVVDSSVKRNNTDIPMYLPNGERGVAGPGYWSPGVVSFNNCNQPNGICYYAPTIDFGGDPNIKAVLNSEQEMVVYFLNERDRITPRDFEGEREFEGLNLGEVSDFVNTHFNVPNFISFDRELNDQFIRNFGLDRDAEIYLLPGEFEIIVDREHKYGYVKLPVFIHTENSAPPCVNPCAGNIGCTEFRGWKAQPVGYTGPLVPDCGCN